MEDLFLCFSFLRGREYREKDYLTGHTDKPTMVSFRSNHSARSPSRDSLGESFLDMPRQTPPRPSRDDSPGRIGDLSSIRKFPYDGKIAFFSMLSNLI